MIHHVKAGNSASRQEEQRLLTPEPFLQPCIIILEAELEGLVYFHLWGILGVIEYRRTQVPLKAIAGIRRQPYFLVRGNSPLLLSDHKECVLARSTGYKWWLRTL